MTGDTLYGFARDGGFVAAIQGTNITSYAYPSSPDATDAKRCPSYVAEMMLEAEITHLPAYVEACGYGALLDRATRNYERLNR